MDRKTHYKRERILMKKRKKYEMYRFLDYVDEHVRALFTHKTCKVFRVTHEELADSLVGLLYLESFSADLTNFEEKHIT